MAPASRAVPSFLGAMMIVYFFVLLYEFIEQCIFCVFFFSSSGSLVIDQWLDCWWSLQFDNTS